MFNINFTRINLGLLCAFTPIVKAFSKNQSCTLVYKQGFFKNYKDKYRFLDQGYYAIDNCLITFKNRQGEFISITFSKELKDLSGFVVFCNQPIFSKIEKIYNVLKDDKYLTKKLMSELVTKRVEEYLNI